MVRLPNTGIKGFVYLYSPNADIKKTLENTGFPRV